MYCINTNRDYYERTKPICYKCGEKYRVNAAHRCSIHEATIVVPFGPKYVITCDL
jgi:hypothetical protein